jgi:hypothetical protein
MSRHLKTVLGWRRERRRARLNERLPDDLEQRKDLLKRVAAGIAANKPPRW